MHMQALPCEHLCALATATTKRLFEAAELCCLSLFCYDHQVLLSVVPLHARTLRSENIRAKEEAKLAVNSSL
jgi:hypothetical protein